MKLTGPLERVLRAFLADPAAPRYGYDLMKASGLPSGTLYPMLSRLQEQGLVSSAWEPAGTDASGRPARRYYRLTDEGIETGRQELARAGAVRSARAGRAGAARRAGAPGAARRGPAGPREHVMRGDVLAQRLAGLLAEWLIGRACRHLPAAAREERGREWTAELPAILADPDVPSGLLRSARALRFAAGHGPDRPPRARGLPRSAHRRRRAVGGSAPVHLREPLAGCGLPGAARRRAAHPGAAWDRVWIVRCSSWPPPPLDLFALAQLIKLVRWLCQHD